MSDCICGHPVDDHCDEGCFIEVGKYSTGHTKYCDCDLARPILDWPDSAGWWWCMEADEPQSAMIEYVGGIPGNLVIMSNADIYNRRGWEEVKEGQCRFVKLTEPNPFVREPE